MSNRKRIALVTLLVVLVVALVAGTVLVACDDTGKGNTTYSIYVKSMGGLGLANVSVTATGNGKEIAKGLTDKNGKFSFSANAGKYNISVGDLPTGYSLNAGNKYTTSETKDTLTILATSSVIRQNVPSDKVYKTGDVMYDFSITDATDRNDEKTYTLSTVLESKKMVLLNFWNTNCGPCMSEMPALELVYNKYLDVAEVFGINVPLMGINTWTNVRETKDDMDLTFPLTIDDNEMPLHFGMTAIPVSVVIDRYGVIALIHTGRLDEATFDSMFEKYTSDNYVQDQVDDEGGGDNPGDVLVREKPNVTQPSSSVIEAAINSDSFSGSYYPETGTDDAEYSWPWLVGGSGNEQYIYPANRGVNYSFATIYTSVTITEQDIASPSGKVVLAFDLKWSCENLADYFYVIINNSLVYEYTGIEHWDQWWDCYALVADEPGEYTLALLYVKDQLVSDGEDTVRIKNMRLMSIEQIDVDSLDMPRDAAKHWDETTFTDYVDVVLGDDGYYHKDNANGPYIVADLMTITNFNKRLSVSWSVSEFAINGYFNYNTVAADDPAYKEELDDTDAITMWAMAANNSELYGLTVVSPELVELLNRFIKSQVGESKFTDKMWLEFCKYFDHYGQDPDDHGICSFERNPIRGLLNITAFSTAPVYQGELDLDNIEEQYKNNVVFDRLLVPRGKRYLVVPDKSGVYRFRSQSKKDADTMAWLYSFDGKTVMSTDEDILVSTDEQLENPDKEYNLILTYYLEEGKQYIFTTAFSDLGVTGEFTFTIEYIGAEAYVWQFVSRNYFTSSDDDMTDIINYENVKPVLHTDGCYYVAKRDANGNYVTDDEGNYVADTSDPIYVDFLSPARFFDEGSLELSLLYGHTDTVTKTLSRIFADMWGVTAPEGGWDTTERLANIKGSALDMDDWQKLFTELYNTYGDNVYIDDSTVSSKIMMATTIGAVTKVLQNYYLGFFDQSNIRYDGLDIDSSLYRDYTDIVQAAYDQAIANNGIDARGNKDKGCVVLTEDLMVALNMFCKRIGGFPQLDTDWMRLCAHYQYMGPNN